MRRVLVFLTSVALVWAVTATGLAQEKKAAKTPAKKPAAANPAAKTPTLALLQAKMHHTMADLIEAQSAAKPDAERIKKLTDRLQTLRNQIRGQWPAAPYGGPGAWQSPRGGPRMGAGPAWGGPGRGYGRRGYGRGGPGRGYGRGPGAGRGPGFGPGYGPGFGRGPGYGWNPGRGLGRRWGFTDEDQDGVCDFYQKWWGQK